jgi:hypothetical protein
VRPKAPEVKIPECGATPPVKAAAASRYPGKYEK